MKPALAGVVALAALSSALVGAARADVLALVIGIDDYKYLAKLEGAVNDARDIAEALVASGAREVTRLTDGEATRDAILGAWKALLAKAAPDDSLVLAYAGHGGVDRTWLLAGFASDGRDSGQRLPGYELAALLQTAAPHPVLVVADTSHGTAIARPVDPRVGRLGVRTATYPAITSDALPPPDPTVARLDIQYLDHVTVLTAARGDEPALEVELDDRAHGALSWAFVRALRGAADADGNGVLSKSELDQFICANVRMRLEGRQHPQVFPTGRGDATLVPALPPAAEPPMSAGMSSMTGAGLPPAQLLPLRVINAPGVDPITFYAQLSGTVPADRGSTGKASPLRLTWDDAAGDMVNGLGDVVATLPEETEAGTAHRHLQGVVDKWALLRRLERDAERRSLAMALEPGDQLHRAGDTVTLVVGGNRARHLTVLALAADGAVRLVQPTGREAAVPDTDAPFRLPLIIEPPFGAGHYVVIASPEPLAALHRDLKALDGKPAATELAALLDRHLTGHSYQLGVHGVYTGPR
ncbi:MAG TPA: caspase family protein [Azospirillaceae bacterium]|nr:caspase family protein [Azospirillaceae bacterium]